MILSSCLNIRISSSRHSFVAQLTEKSDARETVVKPPLRNPAIGGHAGDYSYVTCDVGRHQGKASTDHTS